MTDLQPIKDRAQKAEDEMDRLTAGSPGTNWRWSIPANPEKDSDLILAASAADVRKLVAAVESVHEVHTPTDAAMYSGRRSRIVQVCAGCGTDDGNWQHYPCPTVRAITKALQ